MLYVRGKPASQTPAGTSNELDVQNGWEENTHTHRGADCCDCTKNTTRKNIQISEKNQYQKDAFMCVS